METRKLKFGRNIKRLREASNISQSKFALMIGLSQTYLSGVENGHRNISFDNIIKIADGLDVHPAKLFEDL